MKISLTGHRTTKYEYGWQSIYRVGKSTKIRNQPLMNMDNTILDYGGDALHIEMLIGISEQPNRQETELNQI